MNYIEKLRADIKTDFDEKTFTKGGFETSLSPSKQFRLDATNFWSKELNWDLVKFEIYDIALNEILFNFFVNDSQFFYEWLTANEVDYLICAEDVFGGQTIVDITHRIMSGYSPNEDGFIWTDFSLSPDGKTLATIGCYWGSDYMIKVFDFSSPLTLPLPEIKTIKLLGNDEIILGWLDTETLQMKGIKRDCEREYFEDGSSRSKIISETKVERTIRITDV